MSGRHETRDARLRQLLRQGDPAEDGRAPDLAEQARMRRRVLAQTERSRRALVVPPRMLVSAAAVALAALFVWVVWLPHPAQAPRLPLTPAAIEKPQEQRPLQIQFSTPGGTRMIWILNPEFEV